MFSKQLNLIVFLVLCYICLINARKLIPIGGIFLENGENNEAEIAFNYTILHENMHLKSFEIIPIIKRINPLDSFQAEKIACGLAAQGVAAIFGPNSIFSAGIVGSICNSIGIPHIITNWVPEKTLTPENHNFTRNVYPDNDLFSTVLSEIIYNYNWKKFTIVYEDDNNLIRLENLLRTRNTRDGPITIKKLSLDTDYQSLLKEIAHSHESRIIFDCSPENVMRLLRQGVGLNMTKEYSSYLITSLDAHTLDFSDLQNVLKSNITTIRLMDSNSTEVTIAVNLWRQSEIRNKFSHYVDPDKIKTESALLHDAVQIFASVLRQYDQLNMDITPVPLQCYGSNKWDEGGTFLEHLNKSEENGITGSIAFNHIGKRTNFYLEILELDMGGNFKKIACWNKDNGIVLTRPITDAHTQITNLLSNRTVTVISRIGMPFLDYRPKEEGDVEFYGNDRFIGYSIDLIDSISKKLHFQYRFEIVADNSYGTYNPNTKQWDGLVKELLERRADLAICDLTITSSRRSAVDFTVPFMTLGISILYAKPNKEPPGLLSFTLPLSLDVWLYMATAYLIVSIVLYAVAKISLDDWENPHLCDDNPEELENIWSIKNSAWLTTGAILQQGCDLLPKGISTRLVVGSWWFFALIVTASYTANLAAFLTNERMDESISSAEDLDQQSKIKFGAVEKGSTLLFFKHSKHSVYQRMYATMASAEPTAYTQSNDEGAKRVAKSNRNYAFFMESTSIEYIVYKNCNLTRIGELLDSKGYGIAMPINSPYRTDINKAILELQEEGKMRRLKEKWWKEKNVDPNNLCQNDTSRDHDDENAELKMENVLGIFLVLVIGCILGIFIGFLEFIWNVKKIAIEEKITPWGIFRRELLFALDLRVKIKPIQLTDSVDALSLNSIKSLVSTSQKNDSLNTKNVEKICNNDN